MKIELIQLFLRCKVPSGFSDSDSEIYTNREMRKLLALGGESSQILDIFRSQEERMCRKKWPLSLLSTLPSEEKSSSQPWLFDFFPLFDEQNVYVGTFFHARPFLFLSPLDYVEGDLPHTLRLRQPDNRFSQRECEIIFFALGGLSSKAVAKKLNFSPRTIENKLQTIYQRVGVHNQQQLKNYCRMSGMHQYLPPELLPSGSHVISI